MNEAPTDVPHIDACGDSVVRCELKGSFVDLTVVHVVLGH